MSDESKPDELSADARHRERMQRKKELIDRRIARATIERGVLVVNTGNGKGKSSSGFGMLARSLGHGFHCGVVQFIKGSFSTGEEAFFRRFSDELDYHVMGEGYTWETQDKARDIQAAEAAWRTRPARQHVVVTGRGAPDALVELADTVTEMRVVKHAFQAGIRAQKGIEL